MSACLLASYNSSCMTRTSKTLQVNHCTGIFWLLAIDYNSSSFIFLSSSCCIDHQISSYLTPDQCHLDGDRWRLARHCGKSTCSYLVFIELELGRCWCCFWCFVTNCWNILLSSLCSPLVDYLKSTLFSCIVVALFAVCQCLLWRLWSRTKLCDVPVFTDYLHFCVWTPPLHGVPYHCDRHV